MTYDAIEQTVDESPGNTAAFLPNKQHWKSFYFFLFCVSCQSVRTVQAAATKIVKEDAKRPPSTAAEATKQEPGPRPSLVHNAELRRRKQGSSKKSKKNGSSRNGGIKKAAFEPHIISTDRLGRSLSSAHSRRWVDVDSPDW
ncbi:hypothetical protein BU26DRAFT_552406 [Trematosphaeria pertusa]|uniref:Uncharacterized protein n=1 Tax=Trematosphaeria pertusa TaxID=390896 RepID=A0A6A6ICI4_9PLEO|nr:uncharacterized protein BU26DRAFT_552406 [Trematosphaeria pertusa]KAF2247778.1 hypothetical protein BU26DRAFT_552406 [Trematosphaeria pertusa]